MTRERQSTSDLMTIATADSTVPPTIISTTGIRGLMQITDIRANSQSINPITTTIEGTPLIVLIAKKAKYPPAAATCDVIRIEENSRLAYSLDYLKCVA